MKKQFLKKNRAFGRPALRRLSALLLTVAVIASSAAGAFAAESTASALDFADVPKDSWALKAISAAKDSGLMSGQDSTHFGYGKPVTKAEFVTMLCNMFNWQQERPDTGSFADVSNSHWAYSYVETALSHSVMPKAAAFSPDTAITRSEVASMLVNALGLSGAAQLEENAVLPFTDVTANKGPIAVAKNIGMISGTSATTFNPGGTALREEVASMLTQVYGKYNADSGFLHGFYAISSYSQRELTKDMDAVTLMWSTLAMENGTAKLLTAGESGSLYKLPDSYESITSYLEGNGTAAKLGVYMDQSGGAKEMLTSPAARTAAVDAVISEVTRTYDAIGKNPYSGVTIDIEGLKGTDVKEGLNQFLKDLSQKLAPLGKSLYVAVQPALPDGSYFDGFDYRTIGTLADKVILMAHDYNPTNLSGFTGTEYYKNAALTPMAQVYFSLKAVTDPTTGVEEKSKLVLAMSFASTAWSIDNADKLLSPTPIQVAPQTVAARLAQADTVTGYSSLYRNPWITYTTEDDSRYFLWYENSQSIAEKAGLARLLGVDGISLWRLGNIPAYSGYDVTGSYR